MTGIRPAAGEAPRAAAEAGVLALATSAELERASRHASKPCRRESPAPSTEPIFTVLADKAHDYRATLPVGRGPQKGLQISQGSLLRQGTFHRRSEHRRRRSTAMHGSVADRISERPCPPKRPRFSTMIAMAVVIAGDG